MISGKWEVKVAPWRAQLYMVPLALKCAESDYTQAVALLERQEPVFPALRAAESLHERMSVFPAPRGERSERSVLLWMSEIRPKESHRYRLLPFKSLSSRPSQELGGCLNEVKAGGVIYTFMPKWRIAACIIHEHIYEDLSQFRCSPVEQPLSHLR